MKKSRHNNKKQQYATTGFARRAIPLLMFLVASAELLIRFISENLAMP